MLYILIIVIIIKLRYINIYIAYYITNYIIKIQPYYTIRLEGYFRSRK